MRPIFIFLAGICLLLGTPPVLANQGATAEPSPGRYEDLQILARHFFDWRRSQQPVQGDDIPRVERPEGWLPDFSPEALEDYRKAGCPFGYTRKGLERWLCALMDEAERRHERKPPEPLSEEVQALIDLAKP